MKNYEVKMLYLARRQYYNCAIAESKGSKSDITELHHAGVHNTKVNHKLYPLYIDSVWNLLAVNHWMHMMDGNYGRISYLEAEKREAFLQRHQRIARWMNGEVF